MCYQAAVSVPAEHTALLYVSSRNYTKHWEARYRGLPSRIEMFNIRAFERQDWPATWLIIEPVFRSGETYAFSPEITEDEAYRVWVATPSETFVAVDENNDILGTYYIKPNQPALGSHV